MLGGCSTGFASRSVPAHQGIPVVACTNQSHHAILGAVASHQRLDASLALLSRSIYWTHVNVVASAPLPFLLQIPLLFLFLFFSTIFRIRAYIKLVPF